MQEQRSGEGRRDRREGPGGRLAAPVGAPQRRPRAGAVGMFLRAPRTGRASPPAAARSPRSTAARSARARGAAARSRSAPCRGVRRARSPRPPRGAPARPRRSRRASRCRARAPRSRTAGARARARSRRARAAEAPAGRCSRRSSSARSGHPHAYCPVRARPRRRSLGLHAAIRPCAVPRARSRRGGGRAVHEPLRLRARGAPPRATSAASCSTAPRASRLAPARNVL